MALFLLKRPSRGRSPRGDCARGRREPRRRCWKPTSSARDLLARGHRVIAAADAAARIAIGNQGAGADWAAHVVQSIEASRAALTRLDRGFASNIAQQMGDDSARRGGGAGGAEVLVEWCLL